MLKTVEKIEQSLLSAARRSESRALSRLARLVQPRARSRAGAELGRARAAIARAPAQADKIATKNAGQHLAKLRQLAKTAPTAAHKGSATKTAGAVARLTEHLATRAINRDQGFAPPPPLPPPPPSDELARYARDMLGVGSKIWGKKYTITKREPVYGHKNAYILTIQTADGSVFYAGAFVDKNAGKIRVRTTQRQVDYDDCVDDIEDLADVYE